MKNFITLLLLVLAGGCAQAADTAPLWHQDAGGISPAAGSVDAAIPCQTMIVSLKPGAAAQDAPVFKDKPAPCLKTSLYIGYLQDTLFIEGLDAKGGRLFVVTGPNPSQQTVESLSPAGPANTVIAAPTAPLSTLIRAPVTQALARLRWYDVDAKYQPRLLGESSWVQP